MNLDDIIRMAREAGFEIGESEHYGSIFNPYTNDEEKLNAELERFAALVAAAKDAEHQQTLALQQRSYEREIQIEVEAEREAIIQALPGGHCVDPKWVCDMIRARSKE